MLSNFSYDQALKSAQQIQWKHILIFTICLMALHFLLFEETPSEPTSPPPPKAAAAPPQPPIAKPKPKAKPPPVVQALDEAKPQIDTTPFVVEDVEDGNIDDPYDSIPISEPIAVCLSVKDQSTDLTEFFVHHYHHMGIKRFYVMDDGSEPPLSTFQYPGIPRTALTFTYQPRESRNGYMQLTFYTWCIERYRERHKWIAFIDSDEFLETPGTETLGEVLKTFEANDTVGAVGINWRMHSSSGLFQRPESVRKSFTTCIYDDLEHNGEGSANRHIKTILKMTHAGPPINPHKFETSPDSYTVGEHGDIVDTAAWRTPITRTRIGLHHYAVKTREEFEAKLMRGNGMTEPKDEEFWTEIEDETPHVSCGEMAAYEP